MCTTGRVFQFYGNLEFSKYKNSIRATSRSWIHLSKSPPSKIYLLVSGLKECQSTPAFVYFLFALSDRVQYHTPLQISRLRLDGEGTLES